MTLMDLVTNTNFGENTIWVQKYGASREIEAITDMADWNKNLLRADVFLKDKFKIPNLKRNKTILVVRFVGDGSND